jgi:hypothetical protein
MILHIIGCFWAAAPDFNIETNDSWMIEHGINNDGLGIRYLSSLYWAVVTCTTVGYGDILPTNNWEMGLAIIIIIGGVAMFSYILGDLSTQFADITKSATAKAEIIN